MFACLLVCLDLAITVNFKSANFTCTCTIIFNSMNTHLLDARNRKPSSYLFDGRWRQQRRRDHLWTLARAPRTFCLVSGDTRTKTVTAHGPTAMAGDVAARLHASAINANLTHICCDVHECMFSAIISVAYAHCPVTF